MNESNPPSAPVPPIPPPAGYKDRSTGLVVFGILAILLGCVCAMFLPLMLFGQMMNVKNTGTPPNFSAMLPVGGIYGVLAVALVWLGIGSIKARRWARALLLIFSWSWLVMGFLMLVVMACVMPKIMATASSSAATPGHPALPAAAMTVMMIFMLGFFGVFFVLLPGIFTFFYRSPHVKATCEARDPAMCWTDACPLPVLALCLWLAVGLPMMLLMALSGHSVMPCFGVFVTGLPGALLYLAVAVIWSYAAWALYKLQRRGWWLLFVTQCLYLVSSLLTYASHDVSEMYRLMGTPEVQIQQIQNTGLFTGSGMMWMMVICMVPWLVYLLFIERYVHRPSPVPAGV